MTRVSIVLPTYNRLGQLQRVLGALERQTMDLAGIEVLVVSDGSTDGTNEYLSALDTPLFLIPILQENQGVAAARNHGVERARAGLILFIDDDVVPVPELVAEHVAEHERDGDLIVLGPMLPPLDQRLSPWVAWEERMLQKQYDDMIEGHWEPTARQFYTGNTSLARRHILAAGGFDPAFRRAEDVELAYRLTDLGVRFVFNPRAIGYHYAERSFESWTRIPYAYGRNDVIMARQKGQDWLLPTLAREYHLRHPLTRGLARLCLDRRRLSRAVVAGLRGMGYVLPRYAFSGIFNLLHYQGMADELGGSAHFWALVAAGRPGGRADHV